jgi:hypothetical protein
MTKGQLDDAEYHFGSGERGVDALEPLGAPAPWR